MSATASHDSILRVLIYCLILISLSNAEGNITSKILDMIEISNSNRLDRGVRLERREQTPGRKGRIIAFNTDDESNVTVELGFNVPFLKVPVRSGKSRRSTNNVEEKQNKPLVEINAGGIIVAGVLAATILFVVPSILKNPPTVTRSEGQSSYVWKTINEFDTFLASNNIDSASCAQKSLCWLTKTAKNSPVGKYTESISRSWVMSNLLSGSTIQKALKAGQDDNDCGDLYPTCPVNKAHIDSIANTLVTRFSS